MKKVSIDSDVYQPIFGRLLEGCNICCGDLGGSVVENIHSMVRLQNGDISYDVSDQTTHLIEEAVGGSKYVLANVFKAKIVKPQWIYDTWQNASTYDEVPYALNIFEGLKICTSGLHPKIRQLIIEMIEDSGGVYSSILDRSCTHLIIDEPQGKKYKYAISKGIHILCSRWIYQSISVGYALPYENFLLLNELSNLSQYQQLSTCDSSCNTLEVSSKEAGLHSSASNSLFAGIRFYFTDSIIKSGKYASIATRVFRHGGTIESNIDTATHVISRKHVFAADEKLKMANLTSSGVQVVGLKWMSDSIKENHLLPVGDYKVYINTSKLEQPKKIVKENPDSQPVLVKVALKVEQMRHLYQELDTYRRKSKLTDTIEDPIPKKLKLCNTDCVKDDIESSGYSSTHQSAFPNIKFIPSSHSKKKSNVPIVEPLKEATSNVNTRLKSRSIFHEADVDSDTLPLDHHVSQHEKPRIIPSSNFEIPDSYNSDRLSGDFLEDYQQDTGKYFLSQNSEVTCEPNSPKQVILHINPTWGYTCGGDLIFVHCREDFKDAKVAFGGVIARTGKEIESRHNCLWALSPPNETHDVVKLSLVDKDGLSLNEHDDVYFTYIKGFRK